MTFPKLHNFNEMFTPPIAMQYIMPYLDKSLLYRECCYGMWHMADELRKNWFDVVWNRDWDCFQVSPECDFIITNPPFNWNKKFLSMAIDSWKPFAFLQRLEHLWWVEACRLFKDYDIQIIIPDKRINYITPKMMAGQKVWWSSFHSIWITKGLNLPKQINYINTLSNKN